LYLHLVILSTLLRGPEAWDGLVDRHRALLAAAAILVGMVTLVAAVRIPA
jgi:hypothetical protein